MAQANDDGCCFCLKEPGRSRGCVNIEDLEACKVHCKKNPTDANEALPPDADVDFNPNKIGQPSEAGGKKYVCRTKAMSTATVLQYDPVAFAGNVALELPDFETTSIAFVFDQRQAVADGSFLGADPPAGWRGLLRTVLYVPEPNGASGQGVSQALYLKGHWFDTDGHIDNVVATAAVVGMTPLPPGTTPRDIAEALLGSLSGDTRDALGTIFLLFASTFGPDPFSTGEPPSPVGAPIDLDGD